MTSVGEPIKAKPVRTRLLRTLHDLPSPSSQDVWLVGVQTTRASWTAMERGNMWRQCTLSR